MFAHSPGGQTFRISQGHTSWFKGRILPWLFQLLEAQAFLGLWLVSLQPRPLSSYGLLFPLCLLSLTRTFVTGFGAHPGGPGYSHLKIPTLLHLQRLLPSNLTFSGSEICTYLCGEVHHSTCYRKCRKKD